MQRRFQRFAAVFVVLACLPATSMAAGEGVTLPSVQTDVSNIASLQRGARDFVNYCMGCHSAKYVRYNRLAADLGISEDQLINNLMFAADKPHDTMNIAMPARDAQGWFGQAPPDLTLVARSRGTNWLYGFLTSFYIDESRSTGVNNIVLENAAMPHVLWELQGIQKAIFEEHRETDAEGEEFTKTVFKGFELVQPGKLSAAEYNQFVVDLVTFLEYIGEPVKLKRQRIGYWVLAYLLLFGVLAYFLKVEIWKDIK
jgi:ubiquinol-cytochrome c reductase cytochrome c1 subunit